MKFCNWVGEGMPGKTITVNGLDLNHHPRSAQIRGQYLPLLELSVKEAPMMIETCTILDGNISIKDAGTTAYAP